MAIVRMEDLVPGMVLQADVRDLNGRLLLGQGGAVTPHHLRILRMWGITEADVVMPGESAALLTPMPGVPSASPLVDEARHKVEHLFRFANLEHPLMQELFDYCLLQILQEERREGG